MLTYLKRFHVRPTCRAHKMSSDKTEWGVNPNARGEIMSLFASAGKSNKELGVRIKQVRSVLEHIGLYVGLAVYTAAGAKVN